MAGAFVEALSRHLADERGVEVVVLAPGCPDAPAREMHGRVEVRRVQYFWPASLQKLAYGSGIPWNLRKSLLAWLNVPLFLLVFAWNICRQGRRSDVIHVHWGVMGALAVLSRFLHGRPVLLTVHGTDWRSKMLVLRWLTAWAVGHCDVLTTPSREFQRELRLVRGAGSPVLWIPNGVPLPPYEQVEACRAEASARGEAARLVTVGRLIPERRHDVLMRAFARVNKEFQGAVLVIVGDGPERPALEKLSENLGTSECVEFTGLLPTWEVSAQLRAADLYVSATTVDSFGLAVVEAAAHGLPVVATGVGFVTELVIEGETGHLVMPDDEDGLARAMSHMLGNPQARRKAGLGMRKRVEQLGLTWTECARRVEEAYRAALSGGRN